MTPLNHSKSVLHRSRVLQSARASTIFWSQKKSEFILLSNETKTSLAVNQNNCFLIKKIRKLEMANLPSLAVSKTLLIVGLCLSVALAIPQNRNGQRNSRQRSAQVK
jgi:hypothetical protein